MYFTQVISTGLLFYYFPKNLASIFVLLFWLDVPFVEKLLWDMKILFQPFSF